MQLSAESIKQLAADRVTLLAEAREIDAKMVEMRARRQLVEKKLMAIVILLDDDDDPSAPRAIGTLRSEVSIVLKDAAREMTTADVVSAMIERGHPSEKLSQRVTGALEMAPSTYIKKVGRSLWKWSPGPLEPTV